MKYLINLIVICTILSACSNDESEIAIIEKEKKEANSPEIVVAKEGYVNFKTRKAFEDYISNLNDNESSSTTKAPHHNNDKRIKGFTSIKDMDTKYQTKASSNEESEEGTEEEYALSRCKELIPDSRMEYFLDTTMIVSVADTLYKITEHGTFFTISGNYKELDNATKQFDIKQIKKLGNNCYQVSNKIYLYDTFGKISGDTISYKQLNEDEIICQDEQSNENEDVTYTHTRATSKTYTLGKTDIENDKTFGLSTYKWKTNSWGMITTLFGILGTDCSKTNNFDSKHRVKCNLYKVNYVFYESCGFKVEMQRRKKILFIKYWVSCDPENLVVGIEEFHSSTKLKCNFTNSPLYIEDKGHYVDRFNNCINNMIYTGYCSNPVLSDWLDNMGIATVYAGIKNYDYLNLFKKDPWAYTNQLQKDAVYSGLKYVEDKLYGDYIKQSVKVNADMALIFNRVGRFENYIRGINAYDSDSKTIVFARSGGITFSYGGGKTKISPFDPEDFDLISVKIFGAAQYNGQWKGIRIYKEE